MKASSHEKHSKQQWKKTQKKKVQTHGQGLGRGLAGDMGLNFLFFWFFHGFLQFGQNLENTKKKKKKQKVQTHGQGLGYPHTNQKTKKTKKPKNQKTEKPKNQKTKKQKNKKTKNKKPKNQETEKQKTKKPKKTKKTRLHTPRGGGQMQSVGSCLFVFFWFFFFGFLVFWFFGLCVDSHCRYAKQRLPGTVSGCTRSKVDTLQYSNVCFDKVHSANEQQRGMEFNFVRLRHMLLDLCTGNAAICALPQWPVLKKYGFYKNGLTWRRYLIYPLVN